MFDPVGAVRRVKRRIRPWPIIPAYHRASMSGGEKKTVNYAASDLARRGRPPFLPWLVASVLFLAATCGSLLAYVWWLKLK